MLSETLTKLLIKMKKDFRLNSKNKKRKERKKIKKKWSMLHYK